MDYKETHPEPPSWDEDIFFSQFNKKPYGVGDVSCLSEVLSPDRSACFLSRQGLFNEETGLVLYYGIEAPRTCSKRQAFEWGQMSWRDYWFHKGWLLRMIVPFYSGRITSDYIRPSEMDRDSLKLLDYDGNRGPYIMKHDQLRIALEHTSFNGKDPIEAERRYLEFMSQHGHRFTNPAA